MNAPFQARAGLRDPFTAFVCDDATADMLRPVAVEHGWSPEKVNKGGLRNAVQSLSVSASPNIGSRRPPLFFRAHAIRKRSRHPIRKTSERGLKRR